jgi:WD40 repeat protein
MPKWLEIVLAAVMGCTVAISLRGQVETVEVPHAAPVWVSRVRIAGHLALSYSPAGAFSPDSSLLAIAHEDQVVLMDLREGSIRKVLRPRIQDVTDLQIQSANFLASNILFLLGTGLMHTSGQGTGRPTPLLAFQWDAEQNALAGKVDAVGGKGGFGPIRYFPQIGYLALYKDSKFDLWTPRGGGGGRVTIPDLTQSPNLFEFSPDGHWLLLAQIASSSTADPVVVVLKEHRFVDTLRGHNGTVLSVAFSRDCKRVVTACEDGKVRIFSAPDWKLLQTLTGHQGPVHWAEFSPDGTWAVSAGEDKTMRIWSPEDGKLVQSLAESQAPLLTVSFSPNGQAVAASSEHAVLIWQRTGGGR